MNIDELNALMRETQKTMSRNLAEELYGDNALLNYLNAHDRKPLKWSWQSEVARWRSWLGQCFLKIANSLGEYNDYD